MHFLNGKNIIVGVTGSIAAYKAAELTRLLVQNAKVRIVMTRAAKQFIAPMTFQALSGKPVYSQLLDEQAEAGMGHIELARWADRIIIAPATANCIAKLAKGLADDLLSTLCLTTRAPIVVAPAMNQSMWEHPQTQLNIKHLQQQGVEILGPDEGDQACGDCGPGRMLEPQAIHQLLAMGFSKQSLSGLNVMVTAGPTREHIDPVRFISNRSSGKMGFAVAQAAQEAGANVTLVTGPVTLRTPAKVKRIDVESANEMNQQVMAVINQQDILIGTAAVADYTPETPISSKIKKQTGALNLTLQAGVDIMQAVGNLNKRPFTVGFAAETEELARHAQAKRQRKKMDMIAANLVGLAGQGFEAENNALEVYWQAGHQTLSLCNKHQLARKLISLISERYNG